jgi:hypothetical protein
MLLLVPCYDRRFVSLNPAFMCEATCLGQEPKQAFSAITKHASPQQIYLHKSRLKRWYFTAMSRKQAESLRQ